MNTPAQIAKHLREVHFGGNWTDVCLKEQLLDVTRDQAVKKVYSLNTIVALVYHINYYVVAALKVLEGTPLDSSDKFSFGHPDISSEADWQKLVDKTWNDAEKLAGLIERLPETKLWEVFKEEKYGNYYRNLHGIIEHAHYHLGQIVLIKKILQATTTTAPGG